ncbi:MAG: beta-N-acetylhexosaminidase, partial [Lachnospiraceae bacterium]|nr:beta-N-acetylhexosaminidase [Lachnospiraceae bacterium]
QFRTAVEAYVASLPVEDKVAGLFIVSPEQITGVQTAVMAGDGTRDALSKYAVGGIVYADKNITGAAKFKEMLEKTKEFARVPLFLAINEEPGKGVLATKLKLAETIDEAEIAATQDPKVAYDQATTIASYLREYGLNLNLGIVADVLTNPDSESKDPNFGADPALCASMTAEMAKAYMQWGIASALKFFPGEGDNQGDTAGGLVTVERTLDEMKACEFTSFMAGLEAGANMLMVSHVFAPNVTGDNEQCSRSHTLLTDVLRVEYGLDDVIIITDALNKAAISSYYDSAEAAVASLKAGADMLLLPEDFVESYEGVLEAVSKGVVSIDRIDASLVRIFKVKFKGMSAAEVEALTAPVSEDSEDASGNNESGDTQDNE